MVKSKILILIGIISLVGLFIGHKFMVSYNLDGEGVNLLPVNFFEFLLLVLSLLIVLIILIGSFLISKRQKVKISGKKKILIITSVVIVFTIIFYLLNTNNSELIAPISIICFGVLLFISNTVNKPSLTKLGVIELLLGLSAFVFSNNNLLIMAIGFGVLPIIFGVYHLKKV